MLTQVGIEELLKAANLAGSRAFVEEAVSGASKVIIEKFKSIGIEHIDKDNLALHSEAVSLAARILRYAGTIELNLFYEGLGAGRGFTEAREDVSLSEPLKRQMETMDRDTDFARVLMFSRAIVQAVDRDTDPQLVAQRA